MKIGILTLPLHTNYGGILQAYALQTVLERMGHEVKVINRNTDYKLPLWKTPLVYSKRIIKNILGYKIPLFYEQKPLINILAKHPGKQQFGSFKLNIVMIF